MSGPNYQELAGFEVPPDHPDEDTTTVLDWSPTVEYGDQNEPLTLAEPVFQGSSSGTAPVSIQQEYERGRAKEQKKIEAWRSPDDFDTDNSVAVPSDVNGEKVPTLLVGRSQVRKTVFINNTGNETLYIGNTPMNAKNRGYPVSAGSTFEFQAKAPVYAWAASGGTTVAWIATRWDVEQ